jgi:hypothetical protein
MKNMKYDQPVDLDAIPPRGRQALPTLDVVTELQKITDGFGKRQIPDDIPQEYRTIIEGIKSGQLDVLRSCTEAVQMSEGLIDQIVNRVRDHNAYMAREKKIASKLTEKYKGLWKAVEAELSEEEANNALPEGAGA